jgi:hypothetical protein
VSQQLQISIWRELRKVRLDASFLVIESNIARHEKKILGAADGFVGARLHRAGQRISANEPAQNHRVSKLRYDPLPKRILTLGGAGPRE